MIQKYPNTFFHQVKAGAKWSKKDVNLGLISPTINKSIFFSLKVGAEHIVFNTVLRRFVVLIRSSLLLKI